MAAGKMVARFPGYTSVLSHVLPSTQPLMVRNMVGTKTVSGTSRRS